MMNISEVVSFLKEVKDELKRVTWPSKSLVKNATIAVIVFTAVISVYLWALDSVFNRLFEMIFK